LPAGAAPRSVRLFLALVPPPSPRYAELTRELLAVAPRARPVRDGNWHATLRFLGNDAHADEVVAKVAPVAAGTPPLETRVAGVGAFPTPRKARVAWVGLDAPGLQVLATRLAQALPVTSQAEREFQGHVTLARVDPPADLRAFVAAHADLELGKCTLREIVLFKSTTTPQGPVYDPLARFPLAGSSAF